ncbi:hypothetical protein ABFZ85_06660 [Hyphococcus formosus]|uniref:hypothetical protein n=1 Tax=Hyphococcus formosus TaxID=3143534 RepID=UPI00398A8940
MNRQQLIARPLEKLLAGIGVFIGGFSLTMLVKEGFDIPWSNLVGGLLHAFERQLEIWLSPFARFIEEIFAKLVFWKEIDIHLYPHWKYTFYIIWFYLGRDALLDFRRRRIGVAIYTLTSGAVIALAASVLVGRMPLQPNESGWMLLLVPVVAFILFDTLRSVWRAFFQRQIREADGVPEQSDWDSFKYYMNAVVKPFLFWGAIAGLIFLATITIGKNWNVPNPALLMLFVFLVGNAISLIVRALILAFEDRKENECFWARFERSGSSKLGISMLQAFGVLVIILSINVGLLKLSY